jgi:hypothetical protein
MKQVCIFPENFYQIYVSLGVTDLKKTRQRIFLRKLSNSVHRISKLALPLKLKVNILWRAYPLLSNGLINKPQQYSYSFLWGPRSNHCFAMVRETRFNNTDGVLLRGSCREVILKTIGTIRQLFCYTCMCEIYSWRKAKRIHTRQTHFLVREDVT